MLIETEKVELLLAGSRRISGIRREISRAPRERGEKKAAPTWRIFRTFGGRSFFIGIVEATDEFFALRKAIRDFALPDNDRNCITAEQRD